MHVDLQVLGIEVLNLELLVGTTIGYSNLTLVKQALAGAAPGAAPFLPFCCSVGGIVHGWHERVA